MNDLDIMARTLYGEARGESWEGKVAVAWTIINRVRSDLGHDGKPDWWGEGIINVCKKSGQYSCWNKNDPNLPKLLSVTVKHPVFRECLAAAAAVLSDNAPDPTKGSTHYHTTAIRPYWANGNVPTVEIGSHLFYNTVA